MDWENFPYLIKRQVENNFSILKLIFIIPVFIIYSLLIYFQLFRGKYFYSLAEENRSRMFIKFSPRGLIYDCNNIVIAHNRPSIKVFYYPFQEINPESIKKLVEMFPESKKQLFSGIRTQRVVTLGEDISREKLFYLLSEMYKLSGVHVTTEFRRKYVYNENCAHVLGYTGELTHKEFLNLRSQGYKYTDIIGKTGIEKIYEDYLRGQHGALIMEVDALGIPRRVIKEVTPLPGKDLYLTIDSELQLVARKALSSTGKNGAVVGIDPRNGAVRILVSHKDFDPNKFISVYEDRTNILKDKNLPLLNRTIQGVYPPGSAFKPLVAIAALNEGIISPSWKVFCSGEFQLGKKVFKCWEKKGHGWVDLHNALRISCNVYFANLALKVGIDNIEKYARLFNFGKLTGVDLPYELSGVCPSRKWKTAMFKSPWFDGDTVNVGIGQGYIGITPVQLAVFVSAISNRGVIYTPYLVEKIVDLQGNILYEKKPEKKGVIELKPVVFEIIENAMKDTVYSGTGRAAYISGVTLCGKTGTAQNPHGVDHALFICYGPVKDQEVSPLALAVIVEHGGKGGSVAAPIAREIFTAYVKKHLNVETVPVKSEEKDYGD